MSDYATINETIRTGLISGGLLRRMVREHRCPGIYSGTRFYVNVPMLKELLAQESQQSYNKNN